MATNHTNQRKTVYVGVDEVAEDWGCSRSKAYDIIRKQKADDPYADRRKVFVLSMGGETDED